jgi:acetyl-CoA carboxylase biotin carboxyl carrier protein
LKKSINKKTTKTKKVEKKLSTAKSPVDFALLENLVSFMNEQKLAELKVEVSSTILHMRKFEGDKAPVIDASVVAALTTTAKATPSAKLPTQAPAAPVNQVKTVTIKSPFVGTFYRSSSPNQKPFVEVGQIVKSGDALCIIEAMKLMNEIESDLKGRVVKVLIDNATPVEYGESLFEIEPL